MTSSSFSTKEVYNHFQSILTNLKIQLSPFDVVRKRELSDLFPTLCRQLINEDSAAAMEEYINEAQDKTIQMPFSTFHSLLNEAEYLCSLWYLKWYAEQEFPSDTYFVMKRTVKTISSRLLDDKIELQIETNEDKYPLRLRYTKPQEFLIERLFREWDGQTKALNPDYTLSQEALQLANGQPFYALKYFHDMRLYQEQERPSFWSFNTLSTNVSTVIGDFQNAVKGGYLRAYQPEKFVRLKTDFHRPKSTNRYKLKVTGGYLHVIHHDHCAVVFFKPTGRSKYTAPILAYIDAAGNIHWNGSVREKQKIAQLLQAA